MQLRQTTDYTVHSGNNSSTAEPQNSKWKERRKWRITLAPTAIKGLNRFFHYFALTRSLAAKTFLAEFSFLFRASANIDRINKAGRKVLPQTKREANASSASPRFPTLLTLLPAVSHAFPLLLQYLLQFAPNGLLKQQLAGWTPNEWCQLTKHQIINELCKLCYRFIYRIEDRTRKVAQ